MTHKIISDKPAKMWEEAFPLGNGRMGAMVFGKTDSLKLQINEISLWSGEPYPDADKKEAYTHLEELRGLINSKDFSSAQKLLNKEFTNNGGGFDGAYSASYQTFGELNIKTPKKFSRVKNYIRELDLDRAVLSDSFTCSRVNIRREYFCSAPDNALFVKISSDVKKALTFDIEYERKYIENISASGSIITFDGHCDGNPSHMHFAGKIKVSAQGGTVTSQGDRIKVTEADTVYIFMAAATDYILDRAESFKGPDPLLITDGIIKNLDAVKYEEYKKRHIEDYQKLYNRSSLDISQGNENTKPIDKRLAEFSKNPDDPSLTELFFCFGKYLLLSSSRYENILPANLQGIWCHEYAPPWHCDYHVNINLQMNYWCAGPLNLTECTEPLAKFISALESNGEKTAKAYYNAPGWTLYTISNPWLWTSPGWEGGWAQYPLGGAWLCKHIIEYYNFSGDKSILQKYYNLLKENCLFNLSMVYENEEGYIFTNPATSPENTFKDDEGNTGWVCKGTAMDIEMLYENFTDMINVLEILRKDEELKNRLITARAKLMPLKTGKAGQLCEWEGDWDLNAPEMHHRHVSHLYGLHPGTMISPEKTPELASACRKSLELRGDDGTGWSLAWKINFFARLYDGDHALKLLNRLLRPVKCIDFRYLSGGGVYPNLFDAHPPFQIDGNFGASAGICEMLMQSHVKTEEGLFLINILPALPTLWKNGSFDRLLARGNTEVSAKWNSGMLTEAKIKSKTGGRIALKGCFIPEESVKYTFNNGITYIEAEKDKEYLIRPERI